MCNGNALHVTGCSPRCSLGKLREGSVWQAFHCVQRHYDNALVLQLRNNLAVFLDSQQPIAYDLTMNEAAFLDAFLDADDDGAKE